MENYKAGNIAEKLFRYYWKKAKLSLCKNHLYRGLYVNSCSVDVSAIKNALLKHLQIYSKIPSVGPVQIFSLEIHLWFHFVGIFVLGRAIFRNTWECFSFIIIIIIITIIIIIIIIIIVITIIIIKLQCVILSLLLFVPSKRQTTCTFFYKLISFDSKWAFWKIPTGTSSVKFWVRLSSVKIMFVNCYGLKFSPDFQNTKELS